MLKQTLVTSAVIALTTSLAFAETAPVKKGAAMTTTITASQSGNYLTSVDSSYWLGSKVIGMPVYTSATDERIGEVNNIVIEPNGQIAALVVGVGGFLGVGERDVAVRFQAFKSTKTSDGNAKLTLDVTKEQLKEVAEVKMPSSTTY